jgi:hypothetical protein
MTRSRGALRTEKGSAAYSRLFVLLMLLLLGRSCSWACGRGCPPVAAPLLLGEEAVPRLASAASASASAAAVRGSLLPRMPLLLLPFASGGPLTGGSGGFCFISRAPAGWL